MRAHALLLLAVMVLPLAAVGASTLTYSEQVYVTLQAAVDAASPGDTLLLPEGLIEGPVTVDKPLTIVGAGEKSMLFTYDGPSVMTINSGGVTVSNVTFLLCNTGILVEEAGDVSIDGCLFVENAVGVDIRGGAGHALKGNGFINNVACGAILQNVEGATVEGNYFNFSQPSEWPDIQSLLVGEAGASRIGLKLLGASNLAVTGNTFHDIGRCVYVGNSRGCVISGNSFHESAVGLSMRDSTRNVVEGNEGYGAGELVFLWLSSYNNVTGNVNTGGVISRDVESDNTYTFRGVRLTGRNFMLGAGEPDMGPAFSPLSDSVSVTLLPDPVTDEAWVRIGVNVTGIHLDAVPGSLGLYDPDTEALIVEAVVVNGRTVVSYDVEEGGSFVFAKKLDRESPVAEAGADLTCSVNQAVSFDASGSSDNIGIVEYRWRLGDGLEAEGEKVSHTYTTAGTYGVALSVVDAAGNIGEDGLQVTVLPEEEGEAPGFDLRLLMIPVVVALLAGAYMLYRVRGSR